MGGGRAPWPRPRRSCCGQGVKARVCAGRAEGSLLSRDRLEVGPVLVMAVGQCASLALVAMPFSRRTSASLKSTWPLHRVDDRWASAGCAETRWGCRRPVPIGQSLRASCCGTAASAEGAERSVQVCWDLIRRDGTRSMHTDQAIRVPARVMPHLMGFSVAAFGLRSFGVRSAPGNAVGKEAGRKRGGRLVTSGVDAALGRRPRRAGCRSSQDHGHSSDRAMRFWPR